MGGRAARRVEGLREKAPVAAPGTAAMVAVALAAGAGASPVPAAAQAASDLDLPRVHVLATGGTIASRPDAANLSGNQLVDAVPELAEHARVTVEQVANVGSSALTPDHWLRLARRIDELYRGDPGLAGVLVTHGTDSMEDTAYFLHLAVKDPRPVVLVGAMRSATAVSADGPANLLSAVRTAVDPAARGRGVLVVLNDEIHSARDVRKTDDLRVDAFRSEWGPLGVVDPDGVVFHRGLATAHTVDTPFDVAGLDALPTVPIVTDYTGFDGSTLRMWAERGADGIVLQAFGGGRTSPGATEAVVEVAGQGIPVLLTSRVPAGRVLERSLPGPDGPAPMNELGVVAGGDLPPHRARVLLMLALTETRDAGRIQEMVGRF